MGKKKTKKRILKTLTILVCGSRNWTNKKAIKRELEKRFEYRNDGTRVVVIHGGARGADSFAGTVAKKANVPVEEYPANWERDGLVAGFRRNQRMLEEGKPNLVLAFAKNIETSKGTKDMVERARRALIPVMIFEE